MSLSQLSIERPVFAWILMFGLIFFGTLSFFQMGINENPDVDFPTIRIRYAYEGATPAVMEKDVVEPVESVLVAIQGIRSMTSTSDRGSASIQVEFEIDRDIDFALQEVQTILGRAQRSLPESVDPPTVTKSNASDDPIMYLNVQADNYSDRDLMILFRDQIRDRLSTVEGVAEVRPFGFHEPVLRIDLDASQLAQYQLTATDVVNSIQREHKELPAGRLEFEDSEDTVRVMGEVTELKDFQNMIISRRGGSPNFVPIRLKDIAHVHEGLENIRRTSRFNGNKALAMAVQKQRGANSAATADRVKERIDEINGDLPNNATLGINFDRTTFIRDSVNELVFTLLLSALFTSLICWLFLGSWSATINILLAIPTAIIGTFIFINWLGFTLNTFSLLGLALAIGVVVDDAVIVLENIVRYIQMGWDRINAAFKGSREITFAVIATTLALVSIFAPISFLDGLEGKFFFEFAITISVAVILSSVEALSLAPMRCSQFLRVEKRSTKFGQGFDRGIDFIRDKYSHYLNLCLRNPKKILLLATLFFTASLGLLRALPTEFAPSQDRGFLFVVFQAPDGKSLQYTSKKIEEFESIVKQNPLVDKYYVSIGGFGQGGQSNKGLGFVILKPADERNKSQFEVAEEIRSELKNIEGLRVFIRDRSGSPFGGRRGSPLEFSINGPDPEIQKEIYYSMKEEMEATGLIVGVRSDDAASLPEVHIVPNREEALKRGVEVTEIAEIINATFGGTVASQYTDGSRRFDIWVQLKSDDRSQKQDIAKLYVRNNRGELVRLNEVVDIVSTDGPQIIYRENRLRGVRVDANLSKGVPLGKAVTAVRSIADNKLPKSYTINFEATPDDKLWSTLVIMLLGLIIAYMVLAIQFNSFVDPWIVFLAIPFGLVGSLVALLIGGQSLNIYSAIGILLTMGIVKKNSILLIEFTNQLRDQGENIKEALSTACPTRLRPILMTTAATLAAAIPPALALGPGSETRIPMALTVIGGVSLSAFITLFVVPCAYILIEPKRHKVPVESDAKLKID